ncbi:ADP-ribosylglycohydrolase family protein [Streptomyces sp. NPDC006334]|uniref:ADP-ribosylglycohydrolase family protein n=1 Tax=Streptomyces sp. NPDC006334 TaxID=3156754 RepID=UPI0033B541B5
MAHARVPHPRLDAHSVDRAAGVLLGAAVGDALGVPYEFEARLRDDQQPRMIGGGLGPYEPGEYSDDTQMQVCIAEVAATGADLRSPEALDAIAVNFQKWLSGGASDVGAQTRTVLGDAARADGTPGTALLDAARRFSTGNERAAGNGSLMRTGIVALSHLGDPEAMAEAAVAVSALTHPDPDCADACVLWCSGIRTAVLDGTFDGVRAGLDLIPAERRGVWARRLDEAEAHPPHHFTNNGWVVHALQAAWSAITRTAVPELSPAQGKFPAQHLRLALEAAVRAGTDTDTVAAIAGALLGARWGCSGVPQEWQRVVHGWPGHTGADLVRLAVLTARGGKDDTQGRPSAPHEAAESVERDQAQRPEACEESRKPDRDRTAEPERPGSFLKEKTALSRVRGLLLGLAVGDTLGAAGGNLPSGVPLRAGVSTQLACFTAEGTIRALVRSAHRGLGPTPGVVFHAYCRWAALQGIEPERMRSRWVGAKDDRVWPDGWLAQVPVLGQRRGSAPATVTALSRVEPGGMGSPTTSRGCHALTRALPVAVAGAAGDGSGASACWAREIAAFTHGDSAAQSAAAHAVVLAGLCLTSGTHMQESLTGGRSQVRQALLEGLHALDDVDDPGLTADERDRLHAALAQADEHPGEAARLARLAPDATAPSALLGGLYVAASFPDRDQVDAALRFAAQAPDGDSVACVAGAFLGAAHGTEALPVDLVSRHELAWVLDTLARDLIAQLTDSPSGGEYTSGWDPHWRGRYPGW